jgi:DNA invertase Pin-like site-specific DNA recombinase
MRWNQPFISTIRDMGRLIGYARVSTADQDLQLQLEALQHAGCREDQIFRDVASGVRTARPGLEACVQALAPGDTLVVWRLDRLGRSMVHLVTVIEELLRRQVGFRSLCDGAIDTTTASGELVFHLFSALVQFERRLIQEQTRAGLAAARARGKHGGRQPLRPEDPCVRMAARMYGDQRLTVSEICRTLRISQATFYRYVALGRRAADHVAGNGGLSRGRTPFDN